MRGGPRASGERVIAKRPSFKDQTSSRYRGVTWSTLAECWRVNIKTNGVSRHVGGFDDEREAALAYDRVARHEHGVDAVLNFPAVPSGEATVEEVRRERAALRKRKASSRYRGVSWSRTFNAWIAQIGSRAGHARIGQFQDEREAARAYDRAALALYGEAAMLNFPDDPTLAPALPEDIVRERYEASKQTTSSRYRGVVWSKGKWSAHVHVANTSLSLGQFDEEEDAGLAHDRAALALGADRRVLNFPDDDVAPTNVPTLRREARALYKEKTTSRYRGVHWSSREQRWIACVTADYVPHALGAYTDERAAAVAYDRAARYFHAEAAELNFPTADLDAASPEDLLRERSARRKKRTTSRYRGVTWVPSRGAWHAQINANNRHIFLGSFEDEEAAARAYDRAASELHGARAKLNFPRARRGGR
jgi:hypothetical protein